MKANSKRKQEFSLRCEEESTMASVSDPLLCADNQDYLDGDALMNPAYWGQEQNTDTSLLALEQERTSASSLDMCPTSDLYADDLVDVNAILGDIDFNNHSPMFLEDPTLENNEVFHDIRYTSTPKSRPLEVANSSYTIETTKKRPNFRVLHDITDSINCTNNESFINISHVLDTTPPGQSSSFSQDHQKGTTVPGLCTPPPSVSRKSGKSSPGSGGRKVRIIRKRLRCLSFPTPEASLPLVSCNKSSIRKIDSTPSTSESNDLITKTSNPDQNEEELTYYSGVNSYDICTALLKFIKLPSYGKLSTFKMQMITLMKLRLDLQWKDLAFRYSITEQLVKEVFNTTLTIFSECLIELLPWNVDKKVKSRMYPKTFYVHVVQKHGYQAAVIIGDGRKPVNYASGAFSVNNEPLSVVLDECCSHLIVGDIFCHNDFFYRIMEKNGGIYAELQKNRPPDVTSCREVVSKMMSTYPLLSLEPSTDISKVMITVGALTNLNYMQKISLNTLVAINNRSEETLNQRFHQNNV